MVHATYILSASLNIDRIFQDGVLLLESSDEDAKPRQSCDMNPCACASLSERFY